jgi:hypothetical protein
MSGQLNVESAITSNLTIATDPMKTLPDRLMLQTMPLSAISRWNCLLAYWLPNSDVKARQILYRLFGSVPPNIGLP